MVFYQISSVGDGILIVQNVIIGVSRRCGMKENIINRRGLNNITKGTTLRLSCSAFISRPLPIFMRTGLTKGDFQRCLFGEIYHEKRCRSSFVLEFVRRGKLYFGISLCPLCPLWFNLSASPRLCGENIILFRPYKLDSFLARYFNSPICFLYPEYGIIS